MSPNKPILLAVCYFLMNSVFAANPNPSVKQFINQKDWNFTENKGQVTSSDIKYYGHQGGVYLYCKPGTISFVFTKTENDDKISEATGTTEGELKESPFKKGAPVPTSSGGGFDPMNQHLSKTTTNRADLVLLNSNPNAQILASDKQEYYENYYTTGDADHGITDVHTFKTVTYKDIYPHIDMILHAKESGMKYEFIVHPGGKVSDIQMQWNGLQNMQMTEDGGIKYAMALGEMQEGKPVSFQDGNVVQSSFISADEIISFKVYGFDKSEDLIIDPTLVWRTYYGGGGNDYGLSVATTDFGDVFMVGNTYSTTAIASSGSFESQFQGALLNKYVGKNPSAYIVKFNKNGQRQWASYFGGTIFSNATSVTTDKFGNAYMTGNTQDTTGIATSGAYQSSFNNPPGYNYNSSFIVKFNSNGIRKWATYLGKILATYSNEIASDTSGNIFVTGYTEDSTIGTKNVFQSTPLHLGNAGFLARFDSIGNLKWCSYITGNNGPDYCTGICTNQFGYIFLIGSTGSTSGLATSGAYQTLNTFNFPDNSGLLIAFDPSGNRRWATYYGGKIYNNPSQIASDNNGNVVLTINATFNDSEALKYYHDTTSHGKSGTLLTKFNKDGKILWDTAIDAISTAVISDKYGNIYVSGSNLNAPNDSLFSAEIDSTVKPFYIAQFNQLGKMKRVSTFYGSNNTSLWGLGLADDKFGDVYLTGQTTSQSEMATKWAYQTTYGGFSGVSNLGLYGDAFLARYNFNDSMDAGIANIADLSGRLCPDSFAVSVSLTNYGLINLSKSSISISINNKSLGSFQWSGKLSPGDSLQKIKIGSYYIPGGYDTIKVWTSNPNGLKDNIIENDTFTKIIYMNPTPIIKLRKDTLVCKNTMLTIGTTYYYNDNYTMTSNPASPITWVQAGKAVVYPSTTTTYYLTETDGLSACSNTDSVTIYVPKSTVEISYSNVCANDSVPFIDTSRQTGGSYSWSFGDGTNSSLKNPRHLYKANGSYNIILVVKDSIGCTDTAQKQITISDCVWPGDANDDKVVDMKDFLAIGMAYGDTGLSRPSASLTWTGQPCEEWKDTIAGGINAKHSDCNGDSIVNYADTIAISKNYSLTHSKSALLNQGSPSDPGFAITPLSDSVSIGKTFQASISIGSQKNPVQNLYGMAFTISADPSLFETDKSSIKIISSFFGTDSVDLMDMKIINSSNSSVDIGLTRTDHKNVSGYGSFAILSVPVKASIPMKNIKTALSISNNTQISFNGKSIPLYFSSDSVVVTQHTSAINSASQFLSGITIYPNPFSSSTSVQYTLLKPSKVTIGLFDMTGKQIGIIQDHHQQTGNYSLDIDAENYHLTPGLYMLKFITEDGYVSRKIVKF